MNANIQEIPARGFARCVEVSKRVRWDIDSDVIRGRSFDYQQRFLPDQLSLVNELEFLSSSEQRWLSQIQGRTYANMFGLVERFINAKVLELSQDHWLGDQIALEGLIRFSEEELKHQQLFRRIERLAAEGMPAGYRFVVDPNDLARAVLSKSHWAVLALTLHIELFTQLHYRQSIESESELSPLFKDVFLYHWREESQHAIMDELEWIRIDADVTNDERNLAVGEFIELVAALDGILNEQARADSVYFRATAGRLFDDDQVQAVDQSLLRAYRWQYIVSGATNPRFVKALAMLTDTEQLEQITDAVTAVAKESNLPH